MSTLNRVTLIGRLGKDADTKSVKDKQVTEFSLATEEVWKDKVSGEKKSETEWHDCVLWGENGVIKYLTKGSLIYIEGRKKTEHYEKDGVKQQRVKIIIDADQIRLLDSKSKE